MSDTAAITHFGTEVVTWRGFVMGEYLCPGLYGLCQYIYLQKTSQLEVRYLALYWVGGQWVWHVGVTVHDYSAGASVPALS